MEPNTWADMELLEKSISLGAGGWADKILWYSTGADCILLCFILVTGLK